MEQKIEIPEKIEIEVKERRIIVKGPKGSTEKDFDDPRYNKSIQIKREDASLIIASQSENRKTKAMIGTIKAHVRNMINGVTAGYKYTMKVIYSHFPISISVQGNNVQIKKVLATITPTRTLSHFEKFFLLCKSFEAFARLFLLSDGFFLLLEKILFRLLREFGCIQLLCQNAS